MYGNFHRNPRGSFGGQVGGVQPGAPGRAMPFAGGAQGGPPGAFPGQGQGVAGGFPGQDGVNPFTGGFPGQGGPFGGGVANLGGGSAQLPMQPGGDMANPAMGPPPNPQPQFPGMGQPQMPVSPQMQQQAQQRQFLQLLAQIFGGGGMLGGGFRGF